jgi:transcriptional antiterminator RfaH
VRSDARGNNQQGSLALMEKWYVARSKPRSEELLWKQFRLRNFESYYPCINVSVVNPRARKVQPYFPGYLFVYVDLDLIGKSTLERIPGGIGLVSFGDEPAFIPGSLIYTIKQRIEGLKKDAAGKNIPLNKGDNVVVHDGVFTGYEGIFDIQLSGTDRARVLLSILENRLVSVEMPISCIHRVN